MSLRLTGVVVSVAGILACRATPPPQYIPPPDSVPTIQRSISSTVIMKELPPLRIEKNRTLSNVLRCEPVRMTVTDGPLRRNRASDGPIQDHNQIALTLRCTNEGEKPIRAFRASVSLTDVFKESLLHADDVEHVWPIDALLRTGTTRDVPLQALRSDVSAYSNTSRFLRTARLRDLGERAVDIRQIAFGDGSLTRLVEQRDTAAGVIRYRVEHVN
jgi:hypothetical protein